MQYNKFFPLNNRKQIEEYKKEQLTEFHNDKHDWIQGKLMKKAVNRMSIESRTKFTSWINECKRPLIDNKEKNI